MKSAELENEELENGEYPDFITPVLAGDDDALKVDLLKGVTVDGEARKSLTLREPSVGDMMAARKLAKNDSAMSEVILIANLADVPPAAIQDAKMKDYGRLQDALGFLNG
jgi:tail assembly chaperone E/41/14-like protein